MSQRVNEIIGTSFENEKTALEALNKRYPMCHLSESDVEFHDCDNCDGVFALPTESELRAQHIENQGIVLEVFEHYDSAFDDEPTVDNRRFCTRECLSNTEGYDREHYFTCDWCYRTVALSVGHNRHYRHVDGEIVCLKCYREDILSNGMPREEFENNHIAGMFFSGDNAEPLKAGYQIAQYNVFVRDSSSIKAYCEAALKHIEQGCKVVTGYESLSIVGNEGYITMFVKCGGN